MKILARTLLLLLGVILAGCATAGEGYLWTAEQSILTPISPNVRTPDVVDVGVGSRFFTARCPRYMTADHKEWIETFCFKGKLSQTPPGDEAYSYVHKIKIRSNAGIPYGEAAYTIHVMGTREHCMKVSEAHNHRPDGRINEGNFRLSADPAERCAGPVWVQQQ